jgi:uncharacterized protein (TIGR03083 family)
MTDAATTATELLERRCALLGSTWAWWAEVLDGLDDDAWHHETRLAGWDVAALAAHHAMLVPGLGGLASAPVAGEPDVATATAVLRSFNAPDGLAVTMADGIADMARAHASTLGRSDLVATFAEQGPSSVAAARAAGPVTVRYFDQRTVPLTEAVAILLLEAVVHGLDLADAVGATPPPAPALADTVVLLASMAEPAAFIEAATGRSEVELLPVLR